MKRFSLWCGMLLIIMAITSSCTTMKKDCQGNRHTKLKNGIYI